MGQILFDLILIFMYFIIKYNCMFLHENLSKMDFMQIYNNAYNENSLTLQRCVLVYVYSYRYVDTKRNNVMI